MLEVAAMELDVAFLPRPGRSDVAVVIDVLRMTTTAATLLSRGVERLEIVAGTDPALARAAETGALLFGERDGLPFPGFDGGNSPLEHLGNDYSGRVAILCTTNGSKAVEVVADADNVLLGAIVNAPTVARLAVELARDRITLVCAGTYDAVSLDDVLGAGCIAREVLRVSAAFEPTDAARIALALAESAGGVEKVLGTAQHARVLRDLGFAADVSFAARLGSLGSVARLVGRGPLRFEAVAPD